jgi:hypothetical protein
MTCRDAGSVSVPESPLQPEKVSLQSSVRFAGRRRAVSAASPSKALSPRKVRLSGRSRGPERALQVAKA